MAEPNLPAVVKPAPGTPPKYYLPYYGPEPAEPAVPLSHYLWILRRHRWRILGFVATSVIATLIVSSRLTPIYESTATIDVDRQSPSGVIGQEAVRSVLNDADQFLATQIDLIESDSVLRPVVRKYKLIDYEKEIARSPSFSPAAAEEAPVTLKRLKVARPPNTYLLKISYRSSDPQLAANVVNAVAQSYLEHTYEIRARSSASLSAFMEKQLEELKVKMEASGARLAQFEKELNVINPEEKTSILTARLLQLNTEQTNAQADRVRKEAAYNSVRNGSLEAAQVSTQGETLRKLQERLNEAQEKLAQLRPQYGRNHPEYKKAAAQLSEIQQIFDRTRQSIIQRVEIEYREAANREAMLESAVAATKKEFDTLNARSFEYQALKREAEADKKLYEELVRKIKEAGINASFQNSSIRLADPGRPAIKPVLPNIKLNVLLAFLFSSVLAVGAAVLSDVLDNTIRDAEQVRRTLNTEVVGTLPVVKSWRNRRLLVSSNGTDSSGASLVSLEESSDQSVNGYEEAIHTLRNSILLSDLDRRRRSLLVTSASPGEGKTTTAVHLAVAHARQRHKTLLIDADLRRPSVHQYFGLKPEKGLSGVLLSDVPWQEALVAVDGLRDLTILPAGAPSRGAALIGGRLIEIIDTASLQYDMVILDAPPLLGFPEPLQMATAVDGVVIVTRAGQTNRNAVGTVLTTLSRLKASVVGLVLNEMHGEISDGYYYHNYYSRYYKHYYGANRKS